MPFKEKVSQGMVEINHLDLLVTTPDINIIQVDRGDFTISSIGYLLDDEIQYTIVGNPDYPVDVRGFLVLNTGGVPDIIVDEYILNGIDVPFNFNETDYILLSKLFACRIPAEPVDLSTVEIRVWKILPDSSDEKVG